jgi:hypothetical protein
MSVARAASPMRFIAPFLARVHSRSDEPFIPVDPFAARWRRRHSFRPRPPRRKQSNTVWSTVARAAPSTGSWLLHLLGETLPRQVYLHILLRLPAMYWSRVARCVSLREE